jgi:hypothetical protein
VTGSAVNPVEGALAGGEAVDGVLEAPNSVEWERGAPAPNMTVD